MKNYRIGIIGCGWIAEKMSITLGGMKGVERYAVASRSKEKAERFARAKKVFITEAIWTRYMPLSLKIQQLLKDGVIGTPYMLSANLSYPMSEKERILQPELAGGALLDLGVYALNFAAMAFGGDIAETLRIMKQMDGLRKEWGVTYPCDR